MKAIYWLIELTKVKRRFRINREGNRSIREANRADRVYGLV